jgi:Domain of unknown function (DUF6531)
MMGWEVPVAPRTGAALLVATLLAAAGSAYARKTVLDDANEQVTQRIEITARRLPKDTSINPYSIPDVARSFVTLNAGGEVADGAQDSVTPGARTDGTSCGNPVIASNGNKIEPETDFVAANIFGLSLRRTYNAKTTDTGSGSGLFGPSWFSNLDQRALLDWNASGGVDGQPGVIQRQDGSLRTFQRAADGKWYVAGASARRERIERAADGSTYTFHRADGWKEAYSYGGSILSIANEQGAKWTFEYTSPHTPVTIKAINRTLQRVVHSGGRSVTVQIGVHFGQYVATLITDPAGNSYVYKYDPNYIKLQSVTFPPTPHSAVSTTLSSDVVTYHHGMYGLLEGKSINGARYSTFTYDGLEHGARRRCRADDL